MVEMVIESIWFRKVKKKIQTKDVTNLSVSCGGDSNKSMCGQCKNKFKLKIETM